MRTRMFLAASFKKQKTKTKKKPDWSDEIMVHNHRDMQLKKSMSVEIGSGEILLASGKRKKLQDMKLRGY